MNNLQKEKKEGLKWLKKTARKKTKKLKKK